MKQTPNHLELESKAIEIKNKEKTLDRLSQTVKGFSLLLLPTWKGEGFLFGFEIETYYSLFPIQLDPEAQPGPVNFSDPQSTTSQLPLTGTVNVTPKDHVVYLPSKPGSCLPSKPGSSCIEGPTVSKSGARVQVKMSRRCYLCLQAHSRWRHHSRQSRTTVNGPLTGPPWWRGSRRKSWRRLGGVLSHQEP